MGAKRPKRRRTYDVRTWPILLKTRRWAAASGFVREPRCKAAARRCRSGGHGCRCGNEPRQFPEVLGGGSEEELVFGAVRTSQAQAIELQDAFKVREQHLDLLSLPS